MAVFFVCAGLLGVLVVVLGLNIGRLRNQKKISLGDGGDPEMAAAVRAHGNLIENAPLGLVLIYMANDVYSSGIIAVLSIVFLLSRIVHAAGMLGFLAKGRFIGTIASTAVLLVASILVVLAGIGFKQF